MVIRDPDAIAALCGHSPARHGCHLCELAARLRGATRVDGPPAEPPADCGHVGRRLPVAGSVKEWRECLHPDQPLGGRVVCPCAGCGPRCRGYESPPERAP